MKIRSVSLAVIRRSDCILVQSISFPGVSTTFYRPIGGTIEFGENSKEALVREIKEEIGQEIEESKLVAVIENIFGTEDDKGHEIDFIFETEVKDKTIYDNEIIEGIEGSNNYQAFWKPINFFMETRDDVKLVPDGLLDILTNNRTRNTDLIRHIKTR